MVKGNIPSNTVWAGVPARQICTIDEFYKKRHAHAIDDAVYRRDHIRKTQKRNPNIEEMGFFSFLFLERSEINYNKYIKDIEFNGVKDCPPVKYHFFNTKPMMSFDDFLNL